MMPCWLIINKRTIQISIFCLVYWLEIYCIKDSIRPFVAWYKTRSRLNHTDANDDVTIDLSNNQSHDLTISQTVKQSTICKAWTLKMLRWFETITQSKWKLIAFLVIFRVLNCLTVQTYFNPDEPWQSLEPALAIVSQWHNRPINESVDHSIKTHSGFMTWEWSASARIRSPIQLIPYIIFYQIRFMMQSFSLPVEDWIDGWINFYGPRIMQSILIVVSDYRLFRLSNELFGKDVGYLSVSSNQQSNLHSYDVFTSCIPSTNHVRNLVLVQPFLVISSGWLSSTNQLKWRPKVFVRDGWLLTHQPIAHSFNQPMLADQSTESVVSSVVLSFAQQHLSQPVSFEIASWCHNRSVKVFLILYVNCTTEIIIGH